MKKLIKKINDDAVVGIVTAILIIGLLVSVISIIQVVYVPILMEQREAEHMDKVAEQFAFLTSFIDGQAADGRQGVPIATFVTLGSKELPFLVSSKAFGTLEIIDNSSAITISNKTLNNSIQTSVFPIGTISYSSTNAYYLDQSYIYEAGAMIVSQSQGNSMMVRPGFFVNYDKANNTVNISFDVVNISSIGQKTIAAGFGTYPVQTEFREISKNITFTNVRNMTFATSFSNAWFVFINRSLIGAGLNEEGYPPQFVLKDLGHSVQLDFLYDTTPGFYPTVNISFKIIEIRGQVGPGWVE